MPHLVQMVVNAASGRLKPELNLPPFDAEHAYSYREPNTGSLKIIQPFHSYIHTFTECPEKPIFLAQERWTDYSMF